MGCRVAVWVSGDGCVWVCICVDERAFRNTSFLWLILACVGC